MSVKLCCSCHSAPRRPTHRWCRECFNAYMRQRRNAGLDPLSPEAAKRAAARSYANTYRRRGHLAPEPCEVCGSEEVEMHHDDYDQPLAVRWLCHDHHRAVTNSLAA